MDRRNTSSSGVDLVLHPQAHRALNRLAKWRTVFAGWQLGTRSESDPECRAVRDHREATMFARAELNALFALLIAKGIFTAEELSAQVSNEADLLSKAYEERFPGFSATDDGLKMDIERAAQTMRGWLP